MQTEMVGGRRGDEWVCGVPSLKRFCFGGRKMSPVELLSLRGGGKKEGWILRIS
jgi:hypothetical protein